MKVSTTTAASASAIWAYGAFASASPAAVYLHDGSSLFQDSPGSTLSPVAARCVLAQRANVLQYHSAQPDGWLGDEALEAINAYGVHTSLAEDLESRRATILLEGVEDISSIPSFSKGRHFLIEQSPSLSDAQELLVSLARQSGGAGVDGMSQSEAVRSLAVLPEEAVSGDVFYIARTQEEYIQVWDRLRQEKTRISTLHVPSASGVENFRWGQYEIPGVQSIFRRREDVRSGRHLQKTSARSDFNLLQSRQDSTYNGSLPGILPACFSSQSSCESATLNCTGHGACVKRYSDSSDDSSSGSSVKTCFACQCRSITTTNSQGQTQTTHWGGPACQKRDVSSSFWLLALFSVGMIFLVGFAVGQIWSMGEDDLPSVIGAGVSGPVRRS